LLPRIRFFGEYQIVEDSSDLRVQGFERSAHLQTNEPVAQLIEQLWVPAEDDPEMVGGELPAGLDEPYLSFLAECNGGYTRDNYIHLFGEKGARGHNIFDWNNPELWKKYYGMGESEFCFAEDIFGNQYCFDLREPKGTVKMLMVDDGKLFFVSPTFEFFIEAAVFDRETFEEMRDLSSRYFQRTCTEYQLFHHIAYKHPILLAGSDSDIGNLELSESVMHLRLLGQIVTQVKGLPKGTRIKKVLIDEKKLEVKLVT
jgi:hypothetical protein